MNARVPAVCTLAMSALLRLVPDPSLADGFSSGVAAGDVTADTAILWTRADTAGAVTLEVALDESFTSIIRSAAAEASASVDFSVKLDVGGLTPATLYYYRFIRDDDATRMSSVGRFKTAADADAAQNLRFVFSGDSNFIVAPMTVFGAAAREDAELFLWFGDLIYADVPAGGLAPAATLDAYRAKYRQMWSDEHVRNLLSRMAVLAGWDDHEVVNDYAGLDPSIPRETLHAAYQAFFESVPIRPQDVADDPYRTYRRFKYGSNIEFFMLDERQYRDLPAQDVCGPNPDPFGFILGPLTRVPACINALAQQRSMLGAAQRDWLMRGLRESTAAVKFIVNNVPISYVGVYPYDRWDGYDAERRTLLKFIDDNAIQGVVFLSTDIHANGYNPDVMRYFRRYRRDYGLAGRAATPEIIVGPIGNFTAEESILAVGDFVTQGRRSPIVAGLLHAAEKYLLGRVTAANGLTFIEPNRLSYALINVTTDGQVSFEYRGVAPENAATAVEATETFHDDRIAPAAALPCALPFLGLVGLLGIASLPKSRTQTRTKSETT